MRRALIGTVGGEKVSGRVSSVIAGQNVTAAVVRPLTDGRDIEEALAPAFAIRRKHREQTGLPYYDMSIFTSGRYPAALPEALRPKPGGLLPAQRRVYDD